MILEGIVASEQEDGGVNVAPMGPIVPDPDPATWASFTLRPFKTSRTYANLRRTGEGVLHVTDDVLLLARATIGAVSAPLAPSAVVGCPRLADCCRYYEFRVRSWEDRADRTTADVEVVASGVVRDFFGLNRAKSAVVEAAILASRVGILETATILSEMEKLRIIVEKTGAAAEAEAFSLLEAHARRAAV